MSASANACERVGTLMAEWISGELDAEDSAEVRSHLAGCAACRTEETEMREMIALLERDAAAAGGVRDPGAAYWSGFAERVATKLPRREKAARTSWLWARLPQLATGLAAAAVLVIALNTGVFPSRSAKEAVDPAVADLLAESVAPPSLDELAGLGEADLDRLGNELASAPGAPRGLAPAASGTPASAAEPPRLDPPASSLDALDELSPEQLEKLLERLDTLKT